MNIHDVLWVFFLHSLRARWLRPPVDSRASRFNTPECARRRFSPHGRCVWSIKRGASPKLNDGCFAVDLKNIFFILFHVGESGAENVKTWIMLWKTDVHKWEGHSWLIFFSFFSLVFLFWEGQKNEERERESLFCSSLTFLRLDFKDTFSK